MSQESTKKIQIKHRFTGAVIYECDAPDGLESGMHMRHALESAVRENTRLDGARLDRASLDGASLDGASLDGASLVGARLVGARLDRASLVGARLDGARLDRASLVGARLDGASLVGASLDGGDKLIGPRPLFTIGPIGSRSDYLQAYITDAGAMIRAGCFFGTKDAFILALASEHGDNIHGQEYRAALALIDKHAELWTPKKAIEAAP